MSREDRPDDKRRPEAMFGGWYRAHRLQQSVRSHAGTHADATTRVDMSSDPALAALDSKSTRAINRARASTDEAELEDFDILVRDPTFLALDPAVRRELLLTVTHSNVGRLVNDVAALIAHPRFVELGATLAASAVRVLGRLATRPMGRRALVALLACDGFYRLDATLRRALIRYVGGVRVSRFAPPNQQLYLDERWDLRRADLSSALADPNFEAGDADLQAALLEDFLFRPAVSMSIIEPVAYGGGLGVVFGDPASADSLSYQQSFDWSSDHRAHPFVESPHRCVAEGWDISNEDLVFSVQRAIVSRDEERAVVEWVEKNHLVRRHGMMSQPTMTPGLMFFNSRDFHISLLRTLEIVTAARGPIELSRGHLYNGRPWAPPAPSDADAVADALLAHCLAA